MVNETQYLLWDPPRSLNSLPSLPRLALRLSGTSYEMLLPHFDVLANIDDFLTMIFLYCNTKTLMTKYIMIIDFFRNPTMSFEPYCIISWIIMLVKTSSHFYAIKVVWYGNLWMFWNFKVTENRFKWPTLAWPSGNRVFSGHTSYVKSHIILYI